MNEILEQTIDESVVEFILGKLDEYKKQLDAQNKRILAAKKARLFENMEKIIAEHEQNIKEEYSARVIAKLREKNEHIAKLEEQLDNFKQTLAERVNTFLANSKQEVRALVEEEMRTDGTALKAQQVLDEIRALVGVPVKVTVSEADNAKLARLEEDINILKERLKAKDEANQKLKARLRVYDLVESAPAGDREFYLSQLADVTSVNEAEEKFSRIKKAIKASRKQLIGERVSGVEGRGVIAEDRTERSPRVNNPFEEQLARMEKLAGI